MDLNLQQTRIATKRHKNHEKLISHVADSMAASSRRSAALTDRSYSVHLLLEQIIESAASVRRLYGRRAASCAAGVPRFPLDGGTGHEETTSITHVFLADALGNILRALKAGGSIEMTAILAGTKVGFTLRALAFESDFYRWRNDGSAQRATQHFLKARHLHRAWCFSGLGTARSAFRLLARFFSFALACLAITIHVAARAVFSFHRNV